MPRPAKCAIVWCNIACGHMMHRPSLPEYVRGPLRVRRSAHAPTYVPRIPTAVSCIVIAIRHVRCRPWSFCASLFVMSQQCHAAISVCLCEGVGRTTPVAATILQRCPVVQESHSMSHNVRFRMLERSVTTRPYSPQDLTSVLDFPALIHECSGQRGRRSAVGIYTLA